MQDDEGDRPPLISDAGWEEIKQARRMVEQPDVFTEDQQRNFDIMLTAITIVCFKFANEDPVEAMKIWNSALVDAVEYQDIMENMEREAGESILSIVESN